MNPESSPEQFNEALEKEKAFTGLFEYVLQQKSEVVPLIEYNLTYPKEEFLAFLLEHKNVVLHGSGKDLQELEPRQANDSSKQSGNKNAVYGVDDPVFPIFYAIQDRDKLTGMIESGHVSGENMVENPETGEITSQRVSQYTFKISEKNKGVNPWKNGFIYIFNKDEFHQEKDDQGEFSGEWTSEIAVKPLAKLPVNPEDFRYLNAIEYR